VLRRQVTKRVRRDGKRVTVKRWAKVRTITLKDRSGTVSVSPRIRAAGRYRVTITARSKATGLRAGKAKVFTATIKKAS
jgi:hypothetical protein